jgi:predicted kinase
MAAIVILIGIPGAGKSSYVKKFYEGRVLSVFLLMQFAKSFMATKQFRTILNVFSLLCAKEQ